ncbi:MAG: diguanylate cyclase [Rhodocyclaceae bacterium]|nr:diguanylate cyclase [Rhodocyclaceae bacterium]
MALQNLQHKFLRLFLPTATLLAIGAFVHGQGEIDRQIDQLRSRDAQAIGLGAGSLGGRIATISRDLAYLSASNNLRQAVDDPSPGKLADLAEDFAAFARSKAVYDQIRWIDETGIERVRVDLIGGRPEIVPRPRLQDKAQRYYFTDTVKLRPGELFISPLDLNIEQHRIELPHKPMLRVATPLTDSAGRKRGIAIVNYLGRDMLDAFVHQTAAIAGRATMVDRDGYWLKGRTPDDEWGFMFDRPDLSMAARYPAAWQRISADDQGQARLDDGVWTWQTVRPLLNGPIPDTGPADLSAADQHVVESRQYVWKAVALLSASTLAATARTVWTSMAAYGVLLAAALGYGCWLLAQAWEARAEAEARLRRLNADLETTVNARTEELRLSEQRFRDVAHISADWIWEVDAEGRYLYASETVRELLGYSPAEIVGRTAFDLMAPDEAKRVGAEFASIAATRKPFRDLENVVLGKDGEAHITLTNGMPILDADGMLLGYRGVDRDITAQRRMAQQIQQMAYIDSLTGLPNRRLVADRLETALAASRRSGRHGALLFLDLDNFKPLNDRHGHEAGDLLLIEVARRLQACVRETDTVARLGGDEFLVVLGALDADREVAATQTAHVAEKIAAAVGAPCRLGLPRRVIEYRCTASIGAELFRGHEIGREEVSRRADSAMYAAKAAGRAAIRFYAGDS